MKILFGEGDQSSAAAGDGAPQKIVKASFKIEINDEEKKVRDSQQTTVYHTGQQKQALVEIDQEDRRELERERMQEVEEEDDEEEEDPDEDLNF